MRKSRGRCSPKRGKPERYRGGHLGQRHHAVRALRPGTVSAHGITPAASSTTRFTIAAVSDYPLELITGPEFVTGSTRMKAGASQKMVFDMMSTTVMIQLGRVLDNRMVNVQLINRKITDRAVRF